MKTLPSVPHNQDDELGIGGLSGQQIQQIQVCGLFWFDCNDVIIMYERMKSQCFSGTAQLCKAPHILRLYAILTHSNTCGNICLHNWILLFMYYFSIIIGIVEFNCLNNSCWVNCTRTCTCFMEALVGDSSTLMRSRNETWFFSELQWG